MTDIITSQMNDNFGQLVSRVEKLVIIKSSEQSLPKFNELLNQFELYLSSQNILLNEKATEDIQVEHFLDKFGSLVKRLEITLFGKAQEEPQAQAVQQQPQQEKKVIETTATIANQPQSQAKSIQKSIGNLNLDLTLSQLLTFSESQNQIQYQFSGALIQLFVDLNELILSQSMKFGRPSIEFFRKLQEIFEKQISKWNYFKNQDEWKIFHKIQKKALYSFCWIFVEQPKIFLKAVINQVKLDMKNYQLPEIHYLFLQMFLKLLNELRQNVKQSYPNGVKWSNNNSRIENEKELLDLIQTQISKHQEQFYSLPLRFIIDETLHLENFTNSQKIFDLSFDQVINTAHVNNCNNCQINLVDQNFKNLVLSNSSALEIAVKTITHKIICLNCSQITLKFNQMCKQLEITNCTKILFNYQNLTQFQIKCQKNKKLYIFNELR